ncbi:PH domain-containing protein [Bacillus sp. SJS]|uniref:PH domain-containing protein n=1 Tax=Bacillus sp. SJS TaxID=1423321 RepID=UPI000ADE002B|nr:PH domain-containing protein [Bacillus sp. SJS]
MFMYFPSKKDWWVYLVIWGGALAGCLSPFLAGRDYEALFVTVPLTGFLIWLWFSTGYLIEGEKLTIRYGPFTNTIPIMEITSIRKTKNPFSAPALSLDRLEITYGRWFDIAVVSPKEKQEFIKMLKQIQPDIKEK